MMRHSIVTSFHASCPVTVGIHLAATSDTSHTFTNCKCTTQAERIHLDEHELAF